MINRIEEIPVTADSYPFASAERYCGLAAQGYVEREFYVEGTANVYRSVSAQGTVSDPAEVEVAVPDVPYCNRIVVRAPLDPACASGNVVVEIINPTSFMEIDRMWILGRREFVRRGDIYVGITSKPNTIAKLVEFDAVRYGRLNWANPTPDKTFPFDPAELVRGGALPDIDCSYEPGLFWDMLTDLAWKLRSADADNPIAAYPREAIALTGWSQSASYLFRYLYSFAYRPDAARGGRVFDGYLAAGGVHSLVIPVNQYESALPYAPELRRTERCHEPFIAMQTESENGRMEGWRCSLPDSDRPDFRYRLYEVTGASHDTKTSYVDYYQGDPDLARIDHLPVYTGKNAEPNAYPSEFLFAAGFRNLFHWVRTGAAPARCARIPVDARGENIKDAFGNTKGGIRTCLLEHPFARYSSTSDVEPGMGTVDKTSDTDGLFGHMETFSATMLTELYGSLSNYRALVEADTAVTVSEGLLCAEDAADLVDFAVAGASAAGLV